MWEAVIFETERPYSHIFETVNVKVFETDSCYGQSFWDCPEIVFETGFELLGLKIEAVLRLPLMINDVGSPIPVLMGID